MTEFIINHSTLQMQNFNCPKFKMHICIEKTDLGELVYGTDVPWFEIIWRPHGETNFRSKTMDLLNLVVPDPNVPMLIPQDVYGAVMEIYGMALKKEYNNYAKSQGWNQIEVEQ